MDKGIDCCIVCWKGAPHGTPFDEIPHEEWCAEERKVAEKRGYVPNPFYALHEAFDAMDMEDMSPEQIAETAVKVGKNATTND